MVAVMFWFVISAVSVNGYTLQKEKKIQSRINAVSTKCADASGMNAEEIESAIEDKDIDRLSPCFFKCYINHYGVITQENGKDVVNVPAMLIFVKYYIPNISFMELLNVASEVMICAKEFENSPMPDVKPDCLKTKSLITCLAKKEVLMNAFWLATQS